MTTEAAEFPVLVGVDLVRVSETQRSLDHFGERFLRRVFTEAELADCNQSRAGARVERLAARIAAKEAAIKVLRPARRWLDPRSIEVCRQAEGWPALALHGEARGLAEVSGLAGFSLSLSHEGDYATAVVVAVRRSESRS